MQPKCVTSLPFNTRLYYRTLYCFPTDLNHTSNDATQCLQDNTIADISNPVLEAEVLNIVQETDLCGEGGTIVVDLHLCAD